MTREIALREAERLADSVRKYGVTVSIEAQPGANGAWWTGVKKIAEMSHHIVSRKSMGPTPGLALVKRGRTDVPGPLCNGYGGFDRVFRVITMGIANHSGRGGPLTLEGFTIPQDNGRWYSFGIEYEGGLSEADWDPEFRDFMARSNAGVLDYLGRTVQSHAEHSTWAPGRKIDRLGYSALRGRQEIVDAMKVAGKVIEPIRPAPFQWGDPNAVFADGTRVLRWGSTGTDVKTVQRAVGALVDGHYGNETTFKVKVYQRLHGLVVDGITGPQTWGAILGAKVAPSAPGYTILKVDGYQGVETNKRLQQVLGERVDGIIWAHRPSPTVKALQRHLNSKVSAATINRLTGYPQLRVDGDQGWRTNKVLQAYLGQSTDGIIWQDRPSPTIKALQRRLNSNTF